MIFPLVVCAVAGLTFVQQDIPGVCAAGLDPVSGQPYASYLQHDLDGDGLMDLVLPTGVLFQRDGAFDDAAPVAFPGAADRPLYDVALGSLYLRLSKRLMIVQWEQDDWKTTLDQAITWPDPHEFTESIAWADEPDVEPQAWRQRFLHDLDRDGVPEIVLPRADGVHVYHRGGTGYDKAACLDVLPPPTLFEWRGAALWPPERRHIGLPDRSVRCRLFLSGLTLGVLTKEYVADETVQYRLVQYTLDEKDGFAIDPEATKTNLTETMPSLVRPCRLNSDDTIDYAQGKIAYSQATALPAPIFETYVTLDGGTSHHAIRSVSFPSNCWLVDFDRDGDHDLVAEATDFFDGGVRETVSRLMTDRDIHHEVRVHFQDARGKFSTAPDVRGRFTIQLDKAPWRFSTMCRRYTGGGLLNVTGDFNGDGYGDVAIQDRSLRLAIYLSVGWQFPNRPDATLPIPKDWHFSVADVDGDGKSDIIVTGAPGDLGEPAESRIFLASEEED